MTGTGQNTGKGASCAFALWLLVGLVLLALSISLAVSLGAVRVPLRAVWGIVGHHVAPGVIAHAGWETAHEAIVWQLRLPRTLLAALVGAGLAVVGATLQAVTRNPLADPHLLGISSGGAFGAITALLHTGLIFGLATVPLFAFTGALGATALVLTVSRIAKATSSDRLVLAGVAVSFIVMALANVMIFLGDPRASHTVVFWMLGGLGLAQWSHLAFPLVILLGVSLWFLLRSRDFDAMTIGDETAATLGINVTAFRLSAFVAGALITGVMVAFSGIIGFVGLMVPHIVRTVVGGANARVLPASLVAGAIFLVWCDILARTVMAPDDIPIGVVTGLIGGVFFVWLLRRRA